MNNPGENAPLKRDEAARLELDSAALLRGLPCDLGWNEIEVRARALAMSASAGCFDERARSLDLMAAARALDAIAQGAPAGGEVARARGVWASAAFAAGGNFPAASVAMRRTFPRWRARDASEAALMCALAPALRASLGAQTPLVAALDALFDGEEGASRRVWEVWDSTETGPWASDLWRLARAGLEAAVACASATALSEKPVFPPGFVAKLGASRPTLLPPQLDAVRAGLLCGDNALVALPPGTGKTLLGELFLAASLGAGPGLAVFLVPYVSLGRGVVAALRAHFPTEIPVHRWMGGYGGDEQTRAAERPEIAVMTPERFDALLRSRPEIWAQLRGVVIDEAHALGEGARGVRIEGLIARLRAHQNATDADFGRSNPEKDGPELALQTRLGLPLLLLSAALDESARLQEWAGARRVFASNWTPTARRMAFWRQDGHLEWHAELSGGRSRALGEIACPWPQPIGNGGDDWARVRRLEPLAWSNVAHLAQQFHDARGGAILCLCATRRATREVARALGELFPLQTVVEGAAARCIEAIEARHRTLLPLARALERGVAWHNSSLPPEVRGHLEDALADGQIHAVAATSTLAEGVDLPFAQTIVVDWLKWDEGAQQPLSSALFRNIAGRCGRAGAFTEGDTVVFDNPLGPAQWTVPSVRREVQRRAFVGAILDEPRSALVSAAARECAGDAQVRADGLRTAAPRDGVTAALESQLLALRRERPALNASQTARAFYAARFDGDFAARVANVWAEFEAQGLVENGVLSARGAAIARTDWSPASALKLLGALSSLPAQNFEGTVGAARLNAYLWRALGALPEAGGEVERFFRARSRLVARPEHLEQIGRAWLSGQTPEAIFAALPRAQNLPGLGAWLERDEAPAGTALETPNWNGEFDRWLDWMRAGLESWTPWLWRAASVLAPLAGPRAAAIRWQTWAARWEWGADSAWAISALRAQAPGGRASCAVVGRHWPRVSNSLAPLNCERARAEAAFEAALAEVGGAYCFAGRNVLALRDWVWARAGWSK